MMKLQFALRRTSRSLGRLCTALGVSRHQKARTVVKVGAEGVNLPQGRSCKNKRGAAGRASAQAISLGVCEVKVRQQQQRT